MSTYSDMIERLTTAASKAAGSLATDNIAAVAVELDRIREELEAMPARFFPTMASGEDLTAAAANFGVNRREATRATVTLAITGEAGAEMCVLTSNVPVTAIANYAADCGARHVIMGGGGQACGIAETLSQLLPGVRVMILERE